jgi:hypothetical protein
MTIETLDAALRDWEERLRRVDESLLALEAEPTYQMLAPRSQTRTQVEGETKRVVEPALDALRDLFEQRGKLTEVLDRAREVRASMSGLAFWANEEKERQILELLHGPSIEVETEMTPLARRALLDPGERDVRIVPEQLLAAMATAFEGARDAVVTVRRAWESLEPSLASMGTRLADARATAESLGVEPGVHDELAVLERDLEATRVRVARDPLGTSADVTARLAPRIDALTGRLDGLAALRARVQGGLASAHELHDAVREAHAGAMRAVDRMPAEVEGASAPGTPTDAGLVEGLAPWLRKIDEASLAGRWQAAEVGLARWRDAAQGYVDHDSKIARALVAVVARREELSGRLSARRAQASALAARGAFIDPSAEPAAREAEALLATRPTPLGRAKQLVERYEALVRPRGT